MTLLAKKYRTENQRVSEKLRDQLIMDYSPLIRFVAQRIAARLPSNIELDDLLSAGVIGLMDAIEKYDPSRDNKFKTYAEFRIRGAMLDELRSQDWIPRSIRDKAKVIERCYAELEQKFGRAATAVEVAAALEMTLESYYEVVSRVKTVTLLSIDESHSSQTSDRRSILDSLEGHGKNPFLAFKAKSTQQILMQQIEQLPEKQKLVLSLYYYEELNLKEIGKILEVTESRVSQLHTQAVERLRSRMKNMLTE